MSKTDQQKAKAVLIKLAWPAPNEEVQEWQFLRDLLTPIAEGTHIITPKLVGTELFIEACEDKLP